MGKEYGINPDEKMRGTRDVFSESAIAAYREFLKSCGPEGPLMAGEVMKVALEEAKDASFYVLEKRHIRGPKEPDISIPISKEPQIEKEDITETIISAPELPSPNLLSNLSTDYISKSMKGRRISEVDKLNMKRHIDFKIRNGFTRAAAAKELGISAHFAGSLAAMSEKEYHELQIKAGVIQVPEKENLDMSPQGELCSTFER